MQSLIRASNIATTALLVAVTIASAQQTPTPAAAEWWRLTTALSNDQMEGRDTGTEAYERAAKFVADQFKAYGLKPAGDNGGYFQRFAMHQIDLDTARSSVEIVAPDGSYTPLPLLYETTLTPRAGLQPLTQGKLVFLGYGDVPAGVDLHGKIAVYYNNSPAALNAADRTSFVAGRTRALAQSGAVALVSIDNPAATEPTHWPAAYARSVSITGGAARGGNGAALSLRIAAEAAFKLFAGTNANPAQIIADGEKGLPLPTLELARTLRIALTTTEKDISSTNVIAVLPGSDPTLASEYVALSAHLDGYGYGTPVMGDNLYNGALDDAAYVATLLEIAHIQAGSAAKRSLLFCIFTGEEKGLLGSAYYTQHLTVSKDKIVADLNLDQLRPIFPLRILTMEGIADSTISDPARQVAKQFNIELRPDHEPERRLFSRTDSFNFVRIGVPVAGFVFGYDPGTDEERIYHDWYARRYHKPQDDLATPIDWNAAVRFNAFYRALALAIANNPARPQWLSTSPYAPKP